MQLPYFHIRIKEAQEAYFLKKVVIFANTSIYAESVNFFSKDCNRISGHNIIYYGITPIGMA